MLQPPTGQPSDRWKKPLTGLLLLVAAVGGGVWLTRSPVSQPVAIPLEAARARDVTVHVTGAVLKPGIYTFAESARIADAIDAAGGLVDGGDASRLNLAARLRDGQQVVVPLAGSSLPVQDPPPKPAAGSRPTGTTAPSTSVKVNLNRATQPELEALPGIGAATATRILRYREQRGPFPSLDEFRRARLVSASVFDRIKDQIEAP
jgi:competence protein ComEA